MLPARAILNIWLNNIKNTDMKTNEELILLTINGADRPGVTSALTEILAQNNAIILDIGQADIHNNLTLGILFQSDASTSGDILKEVLFRSYELGVNVRFKPIAEKEYSEWVDMQGRNRYIVTILSRKLTAKQIAGVSRIIAEQGMNIDAIKRLTGRIPLEESERTPKASVEFSVRGTPRDKELMKASFLKLSSELQVDISFQEDSMYRRMRRLICFDMDSTLIETEVIDELAMRAGVGDEVKAITEGADRLMRILKKVGFKIAILSGGFTYFGNYLKQKFGIDYVYANELEVENGKLTGRYVGEIVDGKRKAELLRLIAQVENVDIRQTVAVGDGANDLPMISLAGLGIAFHAKPKVKATAEQSISTIGLDGILYFLGYKDSYLQENIYKY